MESNDMESNNDALTYTIQALREKVAQLEAERTAIKEALELPAEEALLVIASCMSQGNQQGNAA